MAVIKCLEMLSWQDSDSFLSHLSTLESEGGIRCIIWLSDTQALEKKDA